MIVRTLLSTLGLTPGYYAWRMARLTQRRHSDVDSLVGSNGLLFVHIPKCGGTSLWRTLPIKQPFDAHIPARAWRRMLGSRFDRLTVFTVVRNPWDRLVSAFHYLKEARWPDDRRFAEQTLSQIATFDDFCARLRGDFLFRHNIMSFRHFHSQVLYLNDARGRRLVPWVLRLENIDDDLAALMTHAGLTERLEMAHENKSRRGDYRQYYSDATAELVGALYAEDVAALGYTFDGPAG